MRILHLLASPFFSGPAENISLLAAAQRALGHEVTVAVDRLRTEVGAEELAAPRFAELGLLDGGGLELSVKSAPWAVWRDLRSLSGRKLDVVHSHFSHDHYLARLARPRGAVLVRSIHAPRSLRRSLPSADAYTASTPQEVARLPGRHVAILPALVADAFCPPSAREALRRELGLPPGPLIGMVSTFQPSRRHALALEAFSELRARRPDARLVLVGDGALGEELRRRVGELALTAHVTFAGYQRAQAFVRWLQALDEVWILGLGNDWSGRAAAQARACGVRVLAVDEGALGRWADELVPELTPGAVAARALSGRRTDPERASPRAVAEAVLALYRGAGARP